MRTLVAALMNEARQRANPTDDRELARLIAPLVGHDYGKPAVSGWARGTINPPAFVLLAACRVTGISIDEHLYGESLREGLANVQERLAALEARQAGG